MDINDDKSFEERDSGEANEFLFKDNCNKKVPTGKSEESKADLEQKDLSEDLNSDKSDKLFAMENFSTCEPHTCIKSTATGGHGGLHIDIKSYLLIMLQKLGAQQTLKIILATQLQNVSLTHEFYYKCILSSQTEHHQRCVSDCLFCSLVETRKLYNICKS